MKKFLCGIFAVMFMMSLVGSAAFADDYWIEHEGTEDDPYVIDSVQDLKDLRDRVNIGTEREDLYYKLGSDLNVSEVTDWKPIGVAANPFKGHFDGDNYKISLNITSSPYGETINWRGDSKYVNYGYRTGLFGVVSSTGYAVKNLTVDGTIKASHAYIGGIISNLTQGPSKIALLM